MKALGIDFGEKRIGVACGDTETRLARPLVTLAAGSDPAAQVAEIARAEGAELIVLGLPRGLDGQETRQTAVVRAFGRTLEDVSGLRVEYTDEALTSEAARERLLARGEDPKRGGAIDREAAAIILQDFLGGVS